LKINHVRIKDYSDELIWSKNSGRGLHTPKLWYKSIGIPVREDGLGWWGNICGN
jgi:hypothetical protein